AAGAGAVGVFLILKAFASGSSALTGVEAIANGVTAFRHPQSRNAAQTLMILTGICITLFLGVSYLAVSMHSRPSETVSVLSQLGMVRYWRRQGVRRSMVINGVGGLTTGIVTLIVIETKFTEGAWAVIVAIPLYVLGFYGIRRHYRKVARRLRAGAEAVAA